MPFATPEQERLYQGAVSTMETFKRIGEERGYGSAREWATQQGWTLTPPGRGRPEIRGALHVHICAAIAYAGMQFPDLPVYRNRGHTNRSLLDAVTRVWRGHTYHSAKKIWEHKRSRAYRADLNRVRDHLRAGKVAVMPDFRQLSRTGK